MVTPLADALAPPPPALFWLQPESASPNAARATATVTTPLRVFLMVVVFLSCGGFATVNRYGRSAIRL
jgi:hypothetical protein